VTQVSSNIGA